MSDTTAYDVIVVGAGAAGLAAARTLAEKGKRVALLEARDRIGGRIHTIPAAGGGLPIELGAEFVHGLPPELMDLIDEAGLTRFEVEGEFRCSGGVGLRACGDQGEVDQLFDTLGGAELPSADMSFNEFLALHTMTGEASDWARNYVEGFNAADADRISIRSLAKQQAAEDSISGDRAFRVVEGYARVPAFLLRRFQDAGGQVFTSSPARSIVWKPGQVEITTNSRILRGAAALITVPLGVLQARRMAISPEPPQILTAADSLAMGPAMHMVYEFDRDVASIASSLRGVSFVLAPDATPPTWWTTHPRRSALLTGWIAGRKATLVDPATLPETGLATLAAMIGSSSSDLRKHLLGCHLHDWSADTYSGGAYTYVPKGAVHASDDLSVPVENTLFFAGEHTDTSGHWGTVHGALRSGYRAAAQLLSGFTKRNLGPSEPVSAS